MSMKIGLPSTPDLLALLTLSVEQSIPLWLSQASSGALGLLPSDLAYETLAGKLWSSTRFAIDKLQVWCDRLSFCSANQSLFLPGFHSLPHPPAPEFRKEKGTQAEMVEFSVCADGSLA